VRFQVLTATSMKTAVFWDVAPCASSPVDGRYIPDYTAQHPRKQPYSGLKAFPVHVVQFKAPKDLILPATRRWVYMMSNVSLCVTRRYFVRLPWCNFPKYCLNKVAKINHWSQLNLRHDNDRVWSFTPSFN
jgi:hypothetical protein